MASDTPPKVRRFRNLRIAFSVTCGIACVLLIVLWGHTLHNQVRGAVWVSKSHYVGFCTLRHWMGVEATSYTIGPPGTWYPGTYFQDNEITLEQGKSASPLRRWQWLPYSGPDMSRINLTVPLWFPVSLVATVAVLPWVVPLSKLRRYSLRTLLIAMTLVAVVLGLIVYATRQ